MADVISRADIRDLLNPHDADGKPRPCEVILKSIRDLVRDHVDEGTLIVDEGQLIVDELGPHIADDEEVSKILEFHRGNGFEGKGYGNLHRRGYISLETAKEVTGIYEACQKGDWVPDYPRAYFPIEEIEGLGGLAKAARNFCSSHKPPCLKTGTQDEWDETYFASVPYEVCCILYAEYLGSAPLAHYYAFRLILKMGDPGRTYKFLWPDHTYPNRPPRGPPILNLINISSIPEHFMGKLAKYVGPYISAIVAKKIGVPVGCAEWLACSLSYQRDNSEVTCKYDKYDDKEYKLDADDIKKLSPTKLYVGFGSTDIIITKEQLKAYNITHIIFPSSSSDVTHAFTILHSLVFKNLTHLYLPQIRDNMWDAVKRNLIHPSVQSLQYLRLNPIMDREPVRQGWQVGFDRRSLLDRKLMISPSGLYAALTNDMGPTAGVSIVWGGDTLLTLETPEKCMYLDDERVIFRRPTEEGLSRTTNGHLRMYSLNGGTIDTVKPQILFPEKLDRATCITLGTDGNAYAGYEEGTIEEYRVDGGGTMYTSVSSYDTYRRPFNLKYPLCHVICFVKITNTEYIVSGHWGAIVVYNKSTGRLIQTFPRHKEDNTRSVIGMICPYGDGFITVTDDDIRVFTINTEGGFDEMGKLSDIDPNSGGILYVTVYNDDIHILKSKKLQTWCAKKEGGKEANFQTPRTKWEAQPEVPSMTAACISADTRLIVSVDDRNRIVRKDASDGVPYTVVGHENCRKILDIFDRGTFGRATNLKFIDIRDDVICSECMTTLRANINPQGSGIDLETERKDGVDIIAMVCSEKRVDPERFAPRKNCRRCKKKVRITMRTAR